MDNIKLHFDDKNQYLGKVSLDAILPKIGHKFVEVSADEHKQVEQNKDNADYIHKFLSSKEKITEGLEPESSPNKSFTHSGITYFAKGHKVNAPGIVDKVHHGEIESALRDSHSGKPVYKVKYNLPVGHDMRNDPETGEPDHRTTYTALWHHDELMKHNKPITESNLLEISKYKLVNYITNATRDVLMKSSDKASAAHNIGVARITKNKEQEEKESKNREDIHNKMSNRTQNINKAVGKLSMKNESIDILNAFSDDNVSLAQDLFSSALHAKITEKLDTIKKEIAGGMFNESKSASPITGTKKVTSFENDAGHKAEVRYNSEYKEYQVHHYKDGKHTGEAQVSYHDDKDDAIGTAKAELARKNSKE